jgi:hypothetical protein
LTITFAKGEDYIVLQDTSLLGKATQYIFRCDLLPSTLENSLRVAGSVQAIDTNLIHVLSNETAIFIITSAKTSNLTPPFF